MPFSSNKSTVSAGSVTDSSIAANAAIDATKIADGTVTSAEFQYIGNVTSDLQTQLNAKAPLTSPTFVTPVLGVASATSINFGGGALSSYIPATSYSPTLTLVGGAGNTTPVYTTNQGTYIRIGGICLVAVLLVGDGGNEGAGTGVIDIALPIAASANETGYNLPVGEYVNSTNRSPLQGYINPSASSIRFEKQSSLTAETDFTGADQNNTNRAIALKFWYFV